MLPESILEELTRPTPLQRHVVELAWPSLCTVERLQVIAGSGSYDWLTTLAMADAQPIVRYWAARNYYRPRTIIRDGKFDFRSRDELALDETGKNIEADECEIIRLLLDETPYTEATQLSRLVRMRKTSGNFVSDFVEWLEGAQRANIADDELAECAGEFFLQPSVQRDLKVADRDRSVWDDPSTDYYNLKTFDTLWDFFGKAGPRLSEVLLWHLPFRYRGHGLSSDKIANLSDEKLVRLARVYRDEPALEKVLNEIVAYPEHHASALVEQVRDLIERAPWAHPSAPASPQSDLREEMVSVRDELKALREELAQVLAANNRRRWF